MRLKPEQLQTHFTKNGVASSYLIFGEEPLQMMEVTDAIRHHARVQGYSERSLLNVTKDFDWGQLSHASNTPSLFARQRIIELRLGHAKPGKAGAEAIKDYTSASDDNDLLLVTAGKLDKRAQQSAWFKALDTMGCVVQIWPVAAKDLPNWIRRRMAGHDIEITAQAAQFIAERVEGNLLAASQELEILALLTENRQIDVEDILTVVGDTSRYDVFLLVDSALLGDPSRVLRILASQRQEGTEPVLVNWALGRELRGLCQMAHALAAGQPMDKVLSQFKVWRSRYVMIKRVLARHSLDSLQTLLLTSARIDRMIKGQAQGKLRGDPWQALTALTLGLALSLSANFSEDYLQ